MTFVRLHARARRRRRVALAAAVLFLAGAVVVAHSAGHDAGAAEGMAICLAVAGVAATALLGATRAAAERLRLALVALVAGPPAACFPPTARLPGARAGPAFLLVLPR